MRVRAHDGRTAAARRADLALVDGRVIVTGDDWRWEWPLGAVREASAGPEVRLSGPAPADARVLADATAWRALVAAARVSERRERSRVRELRLVSVLALVGVSLTALVFWGVPAASGPLARATPVALEQSIGRNIEGQVSVLFRSCAGDPQGELALRQLGNALGGHTPFQIDVRAVEAPLVNAFALPGGAVLVTDDLIALTETPDELAAVIAHEIAHVEQRHVMQAVWRALGAGLLLDLTVGGGTGAGQQAVLLAGSFADLRYSRRAEAEADVRGMDMLARAGLSSEGLAPFFGRLAATGTSPVARDTVEWLSSHPDTLRRVRDARRRARPGDPALTPAEWAAVRRACDGRGERWRP
jgi:hypothetical protein